MVITSNKIFMDLLRKTRCKSYTVRADCSLGLIFFPQFSAEMPENYLVLRPVEQIAAVRGNCGKFPGL